MNEKILTSFFIIIIGIALAFGIVFIVMSWDVSERLRMGDEIMYEYHACGAKYNCYAPDLEIHIGKSNGEPVCDCFNHSSGEFLEVTDEYEKT